MRDAGANGGLFERESMALGQRSFGSASTGQTQGHATGERQTSAPRSNEQMREPDVTVSRTSPRTATGRATREIHRVVLGEIDRLRRDAGMSIRRLAQEAAVDPGYLSQVFAGSRSPTTFVLVALTKVLGADLSMRVYPTTGPIVRDAIQAPIGEELLRIAAPTWRRSVEVGVYRPARGFIDIVFDEPNLAVAVATEIQSRIDRLEQQIRWAQDKAQSLPSSDMWRFLDGGTRSVDCSSFDRRAQLERSLGDFSRRWRLPTRLGPLMSSRRSRLRERRGQAPGSFGLTFVATTSACLSIRREA